MHVQPPAETLRAITPEWDGERFDDGRPRVPDQILEDLRDATVEQIWSVLSESGYDHQFEGNWLQTHAQRRLIGRAVTAQFLPRRPDFDRAMVETANREGRATRSENQNWLVVESLTENDVMVVDIFGKIYEGTVIGDQLGTAIEARTHAGAVIHGGIRDLEGIQSLPDVSIYYRGTDPTPIRNVTLAGLNIPVRIGGAVALPGDVVLGTPSGVIFIPAHLAEKAAQVSVDTKHRDAFAKKRLAEGRYATSQIDREIWDDEIEDDFKRWRIGGDPESDR